MRRLRPLLVRQGALQWRDVGVAVGREEASLVQRGGEPKGRRRQRPEPGAAAPRESAALLRECLRDLAQSRDAQLHRRALAELGRHQQGQGAVIPEAAAAAAARLYGCLSPTELGLIVSRAVGVGEWGLAEHVLAHGGQWLRLPASPEATVLHCCRKGRADVAWGLLQRLEDGDGGGRGRLLLAPSVYAEVARALGRAGQWQICLEMARSPWVPTEGSACLEAAARACARAGEIGHARAALQEAARRGAVPSSSTYDAVLVACGVRGEPGLGGELLSEMEAAGAAPSEISYGAVMTGCVKTRDWRRALALLKEMRERGVFPDGGCYAAALEVCALVGQWHRVPQLLDSMLAKGLEAPRSLYLRLLGMLSRAGRWREASETLERMGRQGLAMDDMEAHRLVLLACRRSGQWQKALTILHDLRRLGLPPSPACLEIALASCCRGGRWNEADALFQELRQRTAGAPTAAATAAAEGTRREREVLSASYGAMLGLCGRTGRWSAALVLLGGMKDAGLAPGLAHLQGALLACKEADPPRWEEALALLDQVEGAVTGDPAATAACHALALGACGKAGRWQAALHRLRALLAAPAMATAVVEEGCFETVLEGCARAGRWEEAVGLLREAQEMRRREQLPVDADPYSLAMWACVQGGQPEQAVSLMAEMAEAWVVAPNPRAHLTLLKALQQLGRVQESVAAFAAALEGPGPLRLEVHLAKALATALHTCARTGRWREILELLALTRRARGDGDGAPAAAAADRDARSSRSRNPQQEFQALGRLPPGVDVSAAVRRAVEVLVEDGRAHEAAAFLEALVRDASVDLESWLVHRLLFGLARQGDWTSCITLLVEGGLRSRFGVPPTAQAFASAMSGASAGRGRGSRGHPKQQQQQQQQEEESAQGMDEPPDFLAAMRTQGLAPDLVAFNVAANLQRRLGRWERVVALLQEAEDAGVRPDVVTYTTAITACGEAGRWERADELFEAMQCKGVEPTVVTYTALMAALGRAGELGRCHALRRSMVAAGVKPNARFYQSALGALAAAGDAEGCLDLLEEMKLLGQERAEAEAEEEAEAEMRPRLDAETYRRVEAACMGAGRRHLLALVARTSSGSKRGV